jgi:O-acetyl-ADP-ribose deacetylase (regulator of RNase III)
MITYEIGDATNPTYPGTKIICHINNNVGKWGKGFVMALSNRWPKTRDKYLSLKEWNLGDVQFIMINNNTIIANMIAQDGIGINTSKIRRVNYDALETCLGVVADYAKMLNCSVHMPRIGCGLGGGDWGDIEMIVELKMLKLQVFVYDLK